MLLVLGATLPLMAAAAWTLASQFQTQRTQAETLLVNQARSVAALVDSKLRHVEQIARTLAVSYAVEHGDLDAARAEIARTAAILAVDRSDDSPSEIVVAAPDGTALLDSLPPEQRRYRPLEPLRAAIASGQCVISNLLVDPVTQASFMAVTVPVRPQDGTSPAAAVVILPSQPRLSALIRDVSLPPGAFASVQDRTGRTLARTYREAETLGRLPARKVLDSILAAQAGLVPPGTRTLEGVPSTIAFAHASDSGFIVKLDVPQHVFIAPLWASVRYAALQWLLVLACGLGLAYGMMRRIDGAFRRTLPVSGGLAADMPPPVPTGLREADSLANAFRSLLAERDTATEASRQADATIRTLFDNSPIGVIVADTGGRVMLANDAFLATVGCTRADLQDGRIRWDELTPEQWLPRDEAAIAEAVAQGRCLPYEKEYLRPDGTRVPVLISFGWINRTTGVVASFIVDLTSQKAAEAALRDSEARFRTLADAMPQLVWSARPDGSHDYFNARCAAFIGVPDGTVTRETWVALIHPEDRGSVQRRWQHVLRTGAPYEVEYRLRRHDGACRWMLTRAVPMRGVPGPEHPAGEILHWFGSSTDITEIVAARDVLARSRDELETLITERTETLRETERRLAHAERMSALGQLAGGIAHDFNNVLQAVQGGGTLVLRQADASAEVRRLAELVLRAVERGAAITHRLLAFSRRRDLCAQAIDPGELLRGLREILVPTLGVGVEVRLVVPGEVPLLLADKGQLETVLVNLATNARDAMAGQGVLTIAAVAQAWGNDALADAPQLRPGRYVCLSVTDTGAGMDAATLARVTEPFFTTKPKGEGTGLGLAMARDFAEQSGGGLHIRSALNEGTTVTLYLPVAPEAPGAPADP